jgi:RimJ/RimL family protein N-acetyltransferase
MNEITIRKATLDDTTAIAEIICQSWKAAYSGFLSSETIEKHANIAYRIEKFNSILSTDNAWNIHLAVIDDNACGTISFGGNNESNCGEIYFCYVKPEMWGLGVGYKMMNFALEKLKQQGFHEVILYVFEQNNLARKFYERQGFTTDGVVISGNHGTSEIKYRRTI